MMLIFNPQLEKKERKYQNLHQWELLKRLLKTQFFSTL